MAKKKIEVENAVETTETNVQAEEVVKELPEITLEDFKEKVTIKKCIGVVNKRAIVDLVYSNCVIKDELNGVYFIDTIMQDMTLKLSMLRFYTNFHEVNKYANDYAYDYLDEIGVFKYVIESVKEDIGDIILAVSNFKTRVADLNSVGSCLHRIVSETLGKLPDMKDINKLVNNLPKAINKIDKDVLGVFAKELKNGNVTN